MPNNNVAILSIMSKFDEKSAREAAKRADKVYEEALSDIGNVNFDKKLIENFDKAMNLLKNKFKKVNLSSYTNSLLDSIFSDKDIKEKSKDIELFISKIEMLKKASSGQDINAFNTFSAKQIDALISRTEKLVQKQEEINEKTREYNREATKIAKANRSITTIDKNYGNQDYSKTLESLKKSLGTEKEFTAEQNQSIENLAKMVNLYQTMEKSEPQKGTAEAIRYSKDLLAVTQKIKEERDKIDAFSQKGASTYIANNGLSSVDKVSDYTVSKSKEDFVKASLSNLKSQEAKLQSELTTYISDSVQKNLAKVSKEVDAVVDKAEKRVENLQNKIESLQTKSTKTGSDNSIIGGIVSDSDIKSLEEIEDRLYAISDLDAEGEATKQQLKEYIQLYKQYEQLVANDSTVKFDPELKEEYDIILESDSKLKKYADTLDETISKQKELNTVKSDEYSTSVDTQTEQLVKQEEQIKETIQAEKQLQDTQEKVSSNTKISVDAEQAIADINKIKESLNSIPEEKNIKITISDSDYTNTPLLSNELGEVVTAFRGVKDAWSGLINDKGIGFFTDKLKLAVDYADELSKDGKVYQANLSFHNPLEVDGKGARWDQIDFNGIKQKTDDIIQLAKQLGHDGVIFKNIRDGFTDTDEDISNVMVALNAAQIKNEQVIGAVKAGTGEMVDVASKIDNATDTATNSTVESQNKIQEELKETQKVAEQVSEAMSNVGSDKSNISSDNDEIKSQIKDVELLTDKAGKLLTVYRGVSEVYTGLHSNRYGGKTFLTAGYGLSESYSKINQDLQGKIYKTNLALSNPLEFNAYGSEWNNISLSYISQLEDYLKKLQVEISRKITSFYQSLQNIEDTDAKNIIESVLNNIELRTNDHFENNNFDIFNSLTGEKLGDATYFEQYFSNIISDIPTLIEKDIDQIDLNNARKILEEKLQELYNIQKTLADNMLVLDGDYINDMIPVSFEKIQGYFTDEIIHLAENAGFDSVIFKNLKDGSNKNEDIFAVFNENQIKNAELVDLELEKLKEDYKELTDIIENYKYQTDGSLKESITAYAKEYQTLDPFEDGQYFNSSFIDKAIKNGKLKEIEYDLVKFDPDTGEQEFKEKEGEIERFVSDLIKYAESIQEQYAKINGQKIDVTDSPIKDVFQGDAEKSGMDNIASATDEAVQAKKDFATANEGVQSSVDGSKSKLELEAELMNQIAKSAREAADAKKEFVKANTEVKASAESSNNETKKYNTEENANAWKELSYSIQRYSEVSKRISSGNILDGDVEEAERLENKISQLQKLDVLSPTQIEKSEQMLVKLYDKLDDIEKKSKKASLESMQSEIDSYNNKVPEKPVAKNSEFQAAIDNYKNAIKEAQTYLDNLGNTPITEEQTKQWKTLTNNIEKAKKEMDAFSNAERGSDALSRGKEIDTITKYLNKFTGISKEAKQELNGLLDKLKSGDPSVNVKKIHERFLELTVSERNAGREARNLFDIFKDKKIYSFLGQAASMFSFYDLINVGREGFQTIRELDTALTEMKKVSDETTQSLKNYQATTFDVGDAVGATAKTIQNSTADWMEGNLLSLYMVTYK